MFNGRLLTIDSQSNIRNKFRLGYQLICTKENGCKSQFVLNSVQESIRNAKEYFKALKTAVKDDSQPSTSIDKVETTDLDKVNEVQQLTDTFESNEATSLVPDVALLSESKTEITIGLSKDLKPLFGKIFESLESKSEQMRIESFKLDHTSLEDAVLRLSHKESEQEDETENDTKAAIRQQHSDAVAINLYKHLEKSFKNVKIIQQIHAMFLKKFYILRESWMLIAALGILSFFGIFLVPLIFHIRADKSTKLPISFDSYSESEILVQIDKSSNISDQFVSLFSENHKVVNISNIEEAIPVKFNCSYKKNQKNLIAAYFKDDEIIAWFNTQPYHIMPLVINTVNRAILKSIAGNSYDISVTNHPFIHEDIADNLFMRFLIINFLLLLWPLIYIGYYIQERKSRFKLLQFICGTNRLVYWVTNFIFDYILFTIICFVLLGCFSISNYESNNRLEEFGVLISVGSSYGFSWICFIYAFSYLFNKPSIGRLWLFILPILCKY